MHSRKHKCCAVQGKILFMLRVVPTMVEGGGMTTKRVHQRCRGSGSQGCRESRGTWSAARSWRRPNIARNAGHRHDRGCG